MDGVIRDNYGKGEPQKGDADRAGMLNVYVDQIGNFRGKGNHPLQVVENPRWGESNSGLRSVKYPYYPISTGKTMADADVVEFRLAEVVYTYAECLLREGNSSEAKDLVNSVRKRYFSANDWENGSVVNGRTLVGAKDQAPRGFSDAFDMDRMLSEWGLEFYDVASPHLHLSNYTAVSPSNERLIIFHPSLLQPQYLLLLQSAFPSPAFSKLWLLLIIAS